MPSLLLYGISSPMESIPQVTH